MELIDPPRPPVWSSCMGAPRFPFLSSQCPVSSHSCHLWINQQFLTESGSKCIALQCIHQDLFIGHWDCFLFHSRDSIVYRLHVITVQRSAENKLFAIQHHFRNIYIRLTLKSLDRMFILHKNRFIHQLSRFQCRIFA